MKTSDFGPKMHHTEFADAGYIPVLQDTPSLDRRIVTASIDSAPSLRHTRCSVTSLLGILLLRCCLWYFGSHPYGDLWIIHRVGMLTDAFVLVISLPLAYLGIETVVVRSGVMGMAMCWITSMLLVDIMTLVLLLLYVVPLVSLQFGQPMFMHVLTSLFDMWACLLIVSVGLQSVVGVSFWRMYREMRVHRLYPANAKEVISHADVSRAEVCCEPEDAVKCDSGYEAALMQCHCQAAASTEPGGAVSTKPRFSNISDHQKYRYPYPGSPSVPVPGERYPSARSVDSRDKCHEDDEEQNRYEFSNLTYSKIWAVEGSDDSTLRLCGSVERESRPCGGVRHTAEEEGYGSLSQGDFVPGLPSNHSFEDQVEARLAEEDALHDAVRRSVRSPQVNMENIANYM